MCEGIREEVLIVTRPGGYEGRKENMFKWYMATLDSFYSDYKRGVFTNLGFCEAADNIIELAKHEIDLTTGQFKDLLKHKQFLENEVMGVYYD